MLNSLRELSTEAPQVGAVEELDPILDEPETVQYVLESGKAIEHTTDGRTTKIAPDGSAAAFALVTDHRVLFLVGTGGADPSVDIEFPLEEVTTARTRSGLLSSSIVIGTNDESAKFSPKDGDLDAVTDYVDRIAGAWTDLHRSLAGARESIEAFENELEAGEDTHETIAQARSRISSAHHAATKNDDGPIEAMLGMIDPIESDLDRMEVEARLDRVDELVEKTERAAQGDETVDTAVESLMEANERLDQARKSLEKGDADTAVAQSALTDRRDRLDAAASTIIEDAVAHCQDAAADDPDDRVAAWERATERFRQLGAAGWDGQGGVSAEALEFQFAWTLQRRVDALVDRSAHREERGDELGEDHEDAKDLYDEAKTDLTGARELASEHPVVEAGDLDEDVERLDEKAERSEWQWGEA